MINTLRVKADHGCVFHPLADHLTKLRNFTNGEIREFSAFPISLQLLFDQTLSNLFMFLMISQQAMYKIYTNEHVAVDTRCA